MLVAVLDEFGRDSLYTHANPKATDPFMFGYAGVIVPLANARQLSDGFIRLKKNVFRRSWNRAASYEVKGASFFGDADKTYVQNACKRFLNLIEACSARIIFKGRAKVHPPPARQHPFHLHADRASDIVLVANAHAIAGSHQVLFFVFDWHDNHKQKLPAIRTVMLPHSRTSPYLELTSASDSEHSQLVQVADWVAVLVMKLSLYRADPVTFARLTAFDRDFGAKITTLTIPGSSAL